MKRSILIMGHGRMGHAMEHLLDARHDVHIWDIDGVVRGCHATLEEEVAEAQAVLFCLPVNPHYEIASRIAPHLAHDCLCLSIAKGLDESGRTAAQVFEMMLELNRSRGTSFVIVTHDPGIAARAQRILRLQDGVLNQD